MGLSYYANVFVYVVNPAVRCGFEHFRYNDLFNAKHDSILHAQSYGSPAIIT